LNPDDFLPNDVFSVMCKITCMHARGNVIAKRIKAEMMSALILSLISSAVIHYNCSFCLYPVNSLL